MKLPWWVSLAAAVAGFLLCYWWPDGQLDAPARVIVTPPDYDENRSERCPSGRKGVD